MASVSGGTPNLISRESSHGGHGGHGGCFKSHGEPIWRALTRFNVWIGPALVAEWIRIMKDYLTSQGRPVAEETFYLATQWSDPERDVRVARELALDLLKRDCLFCVWTGKKLKEDSLDIDHCFPWSAWPCGDLWNLLPALRSVNQNQKSIACLLVNVSPRPEKSSLIGGLPVIRTMRMLSLANAFGQRRRHLCQE